MTPPGPRTRRIGGRRAGSDRPGHRASRTGRGRPAAAAVLLAGLGLACTLPDPGPPDVPLGPTGPPPPTLAAHHARALLAHPGPAPRRLLALADRAVGSTPVARRGVDLTTAPPVPSSPDRARRDPDLVLWHTRRPAASPGGPADLTVAARWTGEDGRLHARRYDPFGHPRTTVVLAPHDAGGTDRSGTDPAPPPGAPSLRGPHRPEALVLHGSRAPTLDLTTWRTHTLDLPPSGPPDASDEGDLSVLLTLPPGLTVLPPGGAAEDDAPPDGTAPPEPLPGTPGPAPQHRLSTPDGTLQVQLAVGPRREAPVPVATTRLTWVDGRHPTWVDTTPLRVGPPEGPDAPVDPDATPADPLPARVDHLHARVSLGPTAPGGPDTAAAAIAAAAAVPSTADPEAPEPAAADPSAHPTPDDPVLHVVVSTRRPGGPAVPGVLPPDDLAAAILSLLAVPSPAP